MQTLTYMYMYIYNGDFNINRYIRQLQMVIKLVRGTEYAYVKGEQIFMSHFVNL